jgi:hypothetical protein
VTQTIAAPTAPKPIPENMVRTPEARLSYPNLSRPRTGPGGGTAKYSCVLILPKSADLAPMKKALQAAARVKWADQIPRGLKQPFRNGSDKGDQEGYGPDVVFLNVSSEQQPQLFDGAKRKVDGGFFKAGDYVLAALSAYAYDKAGNKGVAFGLRGLQYVREGDRLGGGVDAGAIFETLEGAGTQGGSVDDLFLEE